MGSITKIRNAALSLIHRSNLGRNRPEGADVAKARAVLSSELDDLVRDPAVLNAERARLGLPPLGMVASKRPSKTEEDDAAAPKKKVKKTPAKAKAAKKAKALASVPSIRRSLRLVASADEDEDEDEDMTPEDDDDDDSDDDGDDSADAKFQVQTGMAKSSVYDAHAEALHAAEVAQGSPFELFDSVTGKPTVNAQLNVGGTTKQQKRWNAMCRARFSGGAA